MMITGILQSLADGVVRLFSATGRSSETFSQREFIQHYGMASRPQPGASLLIMAEGNVITAVGSDDRRYRIALADGEVALYDDLGQKVHLTRNGIVASSPTKITASAPEIDITATTKVVVTSPLLHCTGNITADGDISDHVRSMAADRIIYNGHTQPVSGGVAQAPTQEM